MKALPLAAIGCMLALTAVALPGAARAQQKEMPAALIGIWSNDDAAGREQCKAYRKDPVRRDGHDPLVGSVIIKKDLIRSYAEYGEGNFYKIDRISQTGATSWLVRSFVYVDTPPLKIADKNAAAYTGDTMTLNGRTLTWSGPEMDTRILFRCSAPMR